MGAGSAQGYLADCAEASSTVDSGFESTDPGGVRMKRVLIEDAPSALDSTGLLQRLDKDRCGSVVSFLGITRGEDDGQEVLRLEFDAWADQLPSVLHRLAEEAISEFGVHAIAMSHRTGTVLPGEDIVCIHVASPHRKEGFEACAWLIDALKAQAPVWKKEVRADGAHWKEGLG
jgi:molybdopterin synthase catalytic subunit